MRETRNKNYIKYKKYYDEYYEIKQREEYESNKDALNEEYKKLPGFFRKRIDQLKAADPEFWRSESYEIFVYSEAMKIVKALKTVNAIKESMKKRFEEQQRLVNLSEAHSGHSIICANEFAIKYLVSEASA